MNQKNERVPDGAEYMKYPKNRLYKLGKVVMGIDFVGPRYIQDQTEPVHFFTRKYIRPIQCWMMDRVQAQTSDEPLQMLVGISKLIRCRMWSGWTMNVHLAWYPRKTGV